MPFDPRRVQAVTFDAAHTLFHPHPSVGAIYREVMARHGLHYEEAALDAGFRKAFSSVAKERHILDGEAREWSYWRQIVAASISDLHPQPTDFDALFAELWDTFSHGDRWRIDDAAPALLRSLRDRGIAVCLLTNWDHRVRRVVAESPLDGLFHHLFVSSEIGHEKPDLPIFRHVDLLSQGGRNGQTAFVVNRLIEFAHKQCHSCIRLTTLWE